MDYLPNGKYYSNYKHSKQAVSLILSECCCPPEMRIPKHSHENSYLILTLSGDPKEQFDLKSRTYIPSDLAFYIAGEVHSQSITSQGMRCLHVEFGNDWK
ncbi:MAG: hypothetical protein M2R45_01106 [Verrucomicrobia subdivision 3 bacterium]|nr:hypothetical protein [Limisphaerales bacterium]MCS1414217.1 hypothetical protein [Limisphaerales bacterium]